MALFKLCLYDHLLSVLSPAAVQALDEVGGVTQEHGVAGGAADHAQHGQPHVCQRLRGEPGQYEKSRVRLNFVTILNKIEKLNFQFSI